MSELLEILEKEFEEISFGDLMETLGKVAKEEMDKFMLEAEELEIDEEDLPKDLDDFFEMLDDTRKEEIKNRVEKILEEKN